MGRRLALVVLLLAFVPAAQAEGAAEPLVVTDFGDAPRDSLSSNPGPVDSLRYMITRKAKPGSTITFARPGTVRLNGGLTIPERLSGITIDGGEGESRAAIQYNLGQTGRGEGGASAGTLSVLAAGVTIKNLVFNDASMYVGSGRSNVYLPGARVLGNRFVGPRSSLYLVQTSRSLVRGNRFEERQRTALSTRADDRLTIEGNTFANAGGHGLDVSSGVNVVVRRNTFTGSRSDIVANALTFDDNTLEDAGVKLVDGADRLKIAVTANHGSGFLDVVAGLTGIVAGNTIAGSIGIRCITEIVRTNEVRVSGNTVTGGTNGIVVDCQNPRGKVLISGNSVTGHRRRGVLVTNGQDVRITGARVSGNAGAGIFAERGTMVQVSGGRFGGNGGPGIDLAPAGITPNAGRKLANDDLDWPKALEFDKQEGKLRGVTCPGCAVEVWEAEEGGENGEGLRVIGRVTAGSSGRFEYPPRGELDCPDSGRLTVTATRRAPKPAVTSEFSEDVECSCVVSARFKIDPAKVPSNGFSNLGITVSFPNGAKPEPGVLTDTRTNRRPPPEALGPVLKWEEFQKDGPPGGAGRFTRDYFASVSNMTSTAATGPARIWKYKVPYEPPPNARTCGARVIGASGSPGAP